MGYTHYWERPVGVDIEEKVWSTIRKDAEDIIGRAAKEGIQLAWEYDEPGRKPEVSEDAIRLNGVGEEGRETFLITHICPPLSRWREGEDTIFEFCKTGESPYDKVVVSLLAMVKHHFPQLSLSSDGGEGVFVDAPYYTGGTNGE